MGACEKVFTQTITIVQGQSFDNIGTTTDPFIKEFIVAPNANNGQFTVKISLQEAAKIKLRMLDVQTGRLVHELEPAVSKQYTLPYVLQLGKGVYALLLETAKERRVISVLVQ